MGEEMRVDLPEALETFDPWRCQWCGDTGYDLRGLAHHVWVRCETVERLAQENIEDCRRSNLEFREAILRTQAQSSTSTKGEI